jgi:hypothetical protein
VVLGIDGSPADETVLRWGIEQHGRAVLRCVWCLPYLWALFYPWELAYEGVQVPELVRHAGRRSGGCSGPRIGSWTGIRT